MSIRDKLSRIPASLYNMSPLLVNVFMSLKHFASEFVSFHVLVIIYVSNVFFTRYLNKIPLVPKPLLARLLTIYSTYVGKITEYFDNRGSQTISKMDIIRLAIRNMQVKKARTLITIGGVSIGIGAIVFLVSVGFGLQQLVISRVARLDELRQIDVSPQTGSKIKIDDKVVSDIKQYSNVASVYPLIAVVGRVNYQNSISDMAVYGVTTGYLEKSAIKPTRGKVFDSNDLVFDVSSKNTQGSVAGAEKKRQFYAYADVVEEVTLNIHPNAWVRVRKEPSPTAELIGVTKHMEGTQLGQLVAGAQYLSEDDNGTFFETESGETLGRWVKTTVYLWDEQECDDTKVNCIDGKYVAQTDSDGNFIQQQGYIAEINMSLKSQLKFGSVLGEATVANVLASTDLTESTESTGSTIIEDGDWVEIVGSNSEAEENPIDSVALSDHAKREAVVNIAMLKILGISDSDAVGKKFTASFVIPTSLLLDAKKRVESVPAEYTIIGVTPDDAAPIFYVPFIDLRSLGITNYSQLKVVSKTQESLDTIRKQIEGTGFSTASVVDTVEQITRLFSSIRLVLGVMGMIALAVASLGMFNTLTISLMERTREVGLMKAMGMTTVEVQELFLTESIIMGFCAGMSGLLSGFIFGKLLSLVLSIFSLTKGQGFLNISFIPFSFIVAIMILSFIVGVGTGIFPARRSKKISALDALRYE